MKIKHNNPKLMGHSKSRAKGRERFIAIQAYLKKQDKVN